MTDTIIKETATPRDCRHGQLARNCEICDLEQQLLAATKRIEEFEEENSHISECQNFLSKNGINCSVDGSVGIVLAIGSLLKRIEELEAVVNRPVNSISPAREIDGEMWIRASDHLAAMRGREAVPDDPMDTPLPCDITFKGLKLGKGCKLGTLVETARRWRYELLERRESTPPGGMKDE